MEESEAKAVELRSSMERVQRQVRDARRTESQNEAALADQARQFNEAEASAAATHANELEAVKQQQVAAVEKQVALTAQMKELKKKHKVCFALYVSRGS